MTSSTDQALRDARLLRVGAAYVADNATVTAKVTLGEGTNIWYGVQIRGGDAPITIGARTNVQDNTVVHVDPGQSEDRELRAIDQASAIGRSAAVAGPRREH